MSPSNILAKAAELVAIAKEKGFGQANVLFASPDEGEVKYESLRRMIESCGIDANEEFDVDILIRLTDLPTTFTTDDEGNVEL